MTIFDENGHITTEGFFLLVREKADEMQRLELSEHLSFCDRCLEAYLKEMENVTLLETEKNSSKNKMRYVKYKTPWLFHKHFTTAVAAACIAMVLWSSGVFSLELTMQQQKTVERLEQGMEKISWKNQSMLHDMSKRCHDFLYRLDGKEGK